MLIPDRILSGSLSFCPCSKQVPREDAHDCDGVWNLSKEHIFDSLRCLITSPFAFHTGAIRMPGHAAIHECWRLHPDYLHYTFVFLLEH
jgi:hypothetical protein